MATTPPQLGRPIGSSGEETRRRIMAATMRCVAEVGYSRATIREIARQAEMTSGSLYHYFPNKAELVIAAYTEVAQIAIPRLVDAGRRGTDFRDRLVSLLMGADELMRDYPDMAAFSRAILAESAQPLGLAATSDSVFTALRDVTTEIVEQGRRQGALALEADVTAASNVLYALMQGLVEHAATVPLDEYHSTLRAATMLIRGTLFESHESR